MRHVQRNQVLHPENRQPMVLAHSNDDNRDNALRDIPTVSDEKHPAKFHNPNHAITTTVEHRDEKESSEYPLFFSR